MFVLCVGLLISYLVSADGVSSATTFQQLFKEQNRLYQYHLTTRVTTALHTPYYDGTNFTIEARLSIQLYDDFTRARFVLDEIKSSVNTSHGVSTQQSQAVEELQKPWELGNCFSSIYADEEPVWTTNIKRGLSFNFLLSETKPTPTTSDEPCLYGNCIVIYSKMGNKIRKYNSLVDPKKNRLSAFEQSCVPNRIAESWYRPSYSEDPNYTMTSERVYELDEKKGLKSLEMTSDFQYKTHDHILAVSTSLSLKYRGDIPAESIQKLNLTESSIQYVSHTSNNPSNGIWNITQGEIKNKTYDMLLSIARRGIDADNIVRNASLIHSLDFIELLNTMSQLDYQSLSKLFEDVLGTSYELETARNIFLEVLPYVRTEAYAKLVKNLVTEQKSKIEDQMLVSLIRKLPYNVVEISKSLLQELEVLTKLGPNYPQELRHAGILSFATLVYKTMEVSFDQQYFDDVYDKYLRMYNTCPNYLDRLVWLQGLTNIGKSVVNYLDDIYTDTNKDRHERLWAVLASLSIWRSSSLENTLPIIMNETEHIQLRIIALHGFLSSPLGSRDFMNIHDYIKSSRNKQLKKFWYSTVTNLEKNRFYSKYNSASYYIPFIAHQLESPDFKHWATNNLILSQEPSLDVQGPMLQVLTVGGAYSGPPELVVMEFGTGGEKNFNSAVYIIAEGVASNVFKRFQNFNTTERMTDILLEKLKKLKAKIVDPENFHVDIIIKVQGKTVYATHIDQERFDTWNFHDFRKSIQDFVSFGSHINQQLVYYPIQIVKDFPSEIGTPIRFRSTIVSFTSIRGNLTAPHNEELTWRNDIHFRYQGTSVISLSTDSPLQPSEHTARIQQSMVIHLPIKMDFSLDPSLRSLIIIWTNPAQSGGVAMHSRTQLSVNSENTLKTRTVRNRDFKEMDTSSIFFDCENPISDSMLSEVWSSRASHFLTSLQPSQLILSSLHLIASPTAGSCGLILPPHQLQKGNKLKLSLEVDELVLDGNKEYWGNVTGKVKFGLKYYRETESSTAINEDIYIMVGGHLVLMTDGRGGDVRLELNVQQPRSTNKALRNFTICVKEQHRLLDTPYDIDFTSLPALYKGIIALNYSSNTEFSCFLSAPDGQLNLDFESGHSNDERRLDVKVKSQNIPRFDLDMSKLVRNDLTNLIKSLTKQSNDSGEYNVLIQETKDGGSIYVNDRKQLDIDPEKVPRFPSHTTLQILKEFGVYQECHIRSTEVITFGGETIKMPPWHNVLAVGDCTHSPRFIVTSHISQNGLKMNTGGATLHLYMNKNFVQSYGNDFRVTGEGNERIARSKLTGIQILHRPNNESIILVPTVYMKTACGVCMGDLFHVGTIRPVEL